jgi:hypothetical protein
MGGAVVAVAPSGSGASQRNAVGWTPAGELGFEEWVVAGRKLGTISRGSQWWLADWMLYGSARWGEKYVVAARVTGYDSHTLRNMAYVARSVDLSRRRDNLSWSHHAEVSALDPDEQDAWLDLASREGMSVSDLRIELRTARRREERSESGTPSPSMAQTSRVKCPECDHVFDVPIAATDDVD